MIKSSSLYLGRLSRILTVNHKITVLFTCNGSLQQCVKNHLKSVCVLTFCRNEENIFFNIYFVVFEVF